MATIEPKRVPQDKDEELLVSCGWSFAGIALFEHPKLRRAYTKELAIKKTEELMLDVYCTLCGSCGEEECCRPEMCKCFYADHYNKTYHQLSDEHEAFYQLVKAIADDGDEYSVDDLTADARQLLKEFDYESE